MPPGTRTITCEPRLPGFASPRLAIVWLRSGRKTVLLEREVQVRRREVTRLADRIDQREESTPSGR